MFTSFCTSETNYFPYAKVLWPEISKETLSSNLHFNYNYIWVQLFGPQNLICCITCHYFFKTVELPCPVASVKVYLGKSSLCPILFSLAAIVSAGRGHFTTTTKNQKQNKTKSTFVCKVRFFRNPMLWKALYKCHTHYFLNFFLKRAF